MTETHEWNTRTLVRRSTLDRSRIREPMSTLQAVPILALFALGCAAPSGTLPMRYYRLMEAGLPAIAQRLAEAPNADFEALETAALPKDFPYSILAAAVLYTSSHPANVSRGNPRWLTLALRIGDLLASESEKGPGA